MGQASQFDTGFLVAVVSQQRFVADIIIDHQMRPSTHPETGGHAHHYALFADKTITGDAFLTQPTLLNDYLEFPFVDQIFAIRRHTIDKKKRKRNQRHVIIQIPSFTLLDYLVYT